MISSSIRVREEEWFDWIRAVGDTLLMRQVELPARLLLADPAVKGALEHYGLRVHHVRSLLPEAIGPYLFETSQKVRHEAQQQAVQSLRRLGAAHVKSASLDLGLERIRPKQLEEGLQIRLQFLNELLPAAADEGLKLCIVVRLPRPFEGSKSWELAGNLMHDSCLPASCRLALDLVPANMEKDFDINDFIRTYCLHVEVIRFHYSPMWGDDLEAMRESEWLAALRRYGFRGEFVFCPQLAENDTVDQVCQGIDRQFSAEM